MGKIAFIFPGQGAQYVGMAQEIHTFSPNAKKVFDEADEALGFSVTDMIFSGDDETLKITENTQPTILTASVACAQPLLEAGIKPFMTAGLSLGEYGAHVLAGTFSFKDAVKLVRKRGKLMQETVPVGEGAMAALLGLSREDVLTVCQKAGEVGVVEPANFNCPGQIVVAGAANAVAEAVKVATEMGAKRAMLLNVSAPFHCSLLEPAGRLLAKELEAVEVKKPEIPVVSNVTGNSIGESEDVKELLVRQVSSSVRWEDCVKTMLEAGVDTFVEIGPGKTLSGFIKKIDKSVKTLNVEDKASLEATLTALREVAP